MIQKLLGKRNHSAKAISEKVRELAAGGDRPAAFREAQPLVTAASQDHEAAVALADLLRDDCFTYDDADAVILSVLQGHEDDRELLAGLGTAASAARNWDYLNDPPPAGDGLALLLAKLQDAAEQVEDQHSADLTYALATTARTLGREYDDVAEAAYQRVIESQPRRWQLHYDLGLFYKTRGRFREGQAANQRAFDLGGSDNEAVRWNLGICATGARDGETALRVWKQIGNKVELGRFDLPEGGYPSCKVRLAQFPLAERTGEVDSSGPGLEETIWIERLSPCHGIVRSVLYEDLGVDYGDVVLIDGAPVTHHTVGERTVPVFPHLATLEHRDYQLFDFAGTQTRRFEIADLSDLLPLDTVVYSHTEQFRFLCKACWENPEITHHHDESTEHSVVFGQIAAPPQIPPKELLEAVDDALSRTPDVRLLAPTLCRAAGAVERSEDEARRYEALSQSS